jgi:Cu2+-exporting ATPase
MHCRAPLTGVAPAPTSAGAAEASAPSFCCSGCEGAHALLEGAGLGRYYALLSGPGTPGEAEPQAPAWLPSLVEAARCAGHPRARLVLEVDAQGLHCAGCVWVIQALFRRAPGGHHVGINPGLGRLTLTIDADVFPLSTFLCNLARLGYRTAPPSPEHEAETSDGLGVRLGVAFAIAMNAMALSLSGYFGLAEDDPDGLHALFGWVGFGLSLLALGVGGPVFFKGAWQAIKARTLHLDVPIALGLLLAFGGSTWLFLSGRPDAAYFDTLDIFIALMLLGRWAQRRILARNRRLLLMDDGLLEARVRVLGEGGRMELAPLGQLLVGARVLLAPGELVPAAAALPEGAAPADFSLAWMTGESHPVTFAPSEPVPAGAHLLGGRAVELEVREPFSASALGRLLARPAEADRLPATDSFWNHLTALYVAVVLVCAAVAFGLWWSVDPVRALEVTTAVLVVTCPCAIGLATPLAYELAHLQLRRLGLHVRRPGLLDRACRVRHVVFDKTGTLTLGTLTVRDPAALASLAPAARQALTQLTARSNHPRSRALFEAVSGGRGACLDAGVAVTEVPGVGVTDGTWTLARDHEALALTETLADGTRQVHARFDFDEALRGDAAAEVARLAAAGVTVHIASGDTPARAAEVAARIGVAPDHVHAALRPSDKAALIARLGAAETLMVGDGLNDAEAFDAALISGTPAIDRAALPSRSDFFLTTRGVGPIAALLAEAARVRRQTRVNLAIALGYNVAGLAAALAGLLSPVVCAVAMPLSSIVVIALTASTSSLLGRRAAPAACPRPTLPTAAEAAA